MSVPPSLSPPIAASLGKGDSQTDREFTSLIIELYRDHPVLWRVKDNDYFNRTKKTEAWEKMVTALRTLKPGYTVDELKKKINVLRTNLNREYRLKKASGTSTDDILEASLWYYNDLLFVKDQFETATISTSEQQLSVKSESASTHEPSQPRYKKKKVTQDPADKLDGLATEYFKPPESEEDILARAWAMKLKRMSPDQKRFAEKIISDVLFDGEMGTLTYEGVRFVTSNCPWSQPPHTLPPQFTNSTWHQYSHGPVPGTSYVSPSSCPSPSSSVGSHGEVVNKLEVGMAADD